MKQNKRKFKILKLFNKSTRKSSGRRRQLFASPILAGNLKPNDLKTNPTPLSHQKVILNQEFNSLNGCQDSGKIIQIGNGKSLEFQQEVSDTSSNDMDEIILPKDDRILPGADGFPLNNNPRRRHQFGRPRMRGQGINIEPPQNI